MAQIETDFDDFWSAYPKRAGDRAKKGALTAYRARRKEGVTREALITGRDRYQRFVEATGKVGTEFVKQAKTWLSPNCEGWLQSWDLPANSEATAPAFPDYPKALVP